MKEIEELLFKIDENELENISKPRRELISFLKEIYISGKGRDVRMLEEKGSLTIILDKGG